jgi:hypothetical protein
LSYVVTPFEVSSKALSGPARCRFVHLYPAVATRHSDTMDCVFLVNGRKVTVAISCAALTRLADVNGHAFSDQQLADLAARHLQQVLERGYDPTEAELFVDEEQLRRLSGEMGFR